MMAAPTDDFGIPNHLYMSPKSVPKPDPQPAPQTAPRGVPWSVLWVSCGCPPGGPPGDPVGSPPGPPPGDPRGGPSGGSSGWSRPGPVFEASVSVHRPLSRSSQKIGWSPLGILKYPISEIPHYSRVAHSDLPTPAPGSLRISPRPQMEGGRLGEGLGKVFMGFTLGIVVKT